MSHNFHELIKCLLIVLGKDNQDPEKSDLTGFLMVKRSGAGFPGGVPGRGSRTQTRQVEEVSARTVLEAAYISLLQGMVRLMGGGSDRSPGRGVAG